MKRMIYYIIILSLVSALFYPLSAGAAGKIEISRKNITISEGKTLRLKLTGVSKKHISKIKWRSSDKRVAKVSSKGLVKAVSKGKARISAKYKGKRYTCKVRVRDLPENEDEEENEETEKPTNTPQITAMSVKPTPTKKPVKATATNTPAVTAPAPGKIVVHRGKTSVAPENTIDAIEQAVLSGYKYVEIDIRFTADGIPVVLHDKTIDRTSNGKGEIDKMTYAQASKYDFGVKYNKKYTGTRLPLLDEVVAYCKNKKCGLYIEIKDETVAPELIETVGNIINKYDMCKNVSIISFYGQNLIDFSKIIPDCRYGILAWHIQGDGIVNMLNMFHEVAGSEVFIDVYHESHTLTIENVSRINV